mgnify:CR=1 FL=1
MDLKRFSQESRKRLMSGVARRLLYWGFDAEGNCTESVSKVPGGYQFRGAVHDDPGVPALWDALKVAIGRKGVEVIVEEAAYTWFNRMMAMQILSKQGFEEPQLDFAGGDSLVPQILKRAQQGHAPFLSPAEKTRLDVLIGSFTRDQEALALLISGFCHHHKTLSRVFGKPDDYTELLLPDDMLKETGFLHLLNTTDALTDEEYQKVELIGWLYQFYISERKDEVFAAFGKGKKAEAKDIPAATQIFTPNWIVKYMVENTAGKAWLDRFPDSPLKGEMQYLVENESDGTREPIIGDVEELTLIDPACGSGHILVEGFDLLYKMYLERYYSPEEAVDSILKRNLFGLDIDDRAAQLATFAVLLKAAKYDRDVWSRSVLPQVFAMPEAKPFNPQETKDFLGPDGAQYASSLQVALNRMQDAKNLGSVMKLELSPEAQEFTAHRFKSLQSSDSRNFNEETVLRDISPFIPPLLALTRKYTAVVANPPYMGQRNMNAELKAYVNKHYPISKSDLFAVFMESSLAQTTKPGYVGMINQHSWMFLSSYEKLREELLKKHSIVSMLHLGPRAFEELSGEVVQSTAFVLRNGGGVSSGNYHRLVDDSNIHEKEKSFLVRKSEFQNISQTNFAKIPGSPIAYWVSNSFLRAFEEFDSFESVAIPKVGMQTADNKKFLRRWMELGKKSLSIGSGWVTYIKGGGFRRWYGNFEYLLDFRNNGEELRLTKNATTQDVAVLSKMKYTWNSVSSRKFCCRLGAEYAFHDIGGHCFYPDPSDADFLLGFLNTSVFQYFISVLNPTINYQVGDVGAVPLAETNVETRTRVVFLVNKNVTICRDDWNYHELSWEFLHSPLLRHRGTLEEDFHDFLNSSNDAFFGLHGNEQELNRIFIELYGLQDELTPEVPLKDITILQDELDSDDLEALEDEFRVNGGQPIELPLKRDVVMQQFLSYCVGLMMGRYRLDRPGLNIAHPNPTADELSSYFNNGHQVEIDEDAILPVMGSECQFPDDVLHRLHGLLDAIWGAETRTANLNFLQECMGKDVEKYLVKDFFKDHCGRYKKKPIYWLFASKKGAFQVLVYMHRMNAFTVEKIRSNYLLEHLKHLRQEEQRLAANALNLSARDAKRLDKLRKDIAECEAYDLDLKDVADRQIAFDLDDGVTANHKLFGSVVAPIK